jgi:hypothetical protein
MTNHNIGAPCRCLDCQAAGVTHLCVVRVPGDHLISVEHWLHGEPLRAWYDARDRMLREARERLQPPSEGGAP